MTQRGQLLKAKSQISLESAEQKAQIRKPYNLVPESLKRKETSILVDSKQLRQIDGRDFKDSFVQGGKFTLIEAEMAIE